MEARIREAKPEDFERLEQILYENNMLDNPDIDGKIAMQRVYERMGKYFLVAENEEGVVGVLRGVYDGSRAMIHQIAVDRKYQRRGIGKKLINEVSRRFKEDGAKTVSLTSTQGSMNYYRNLGFFEVPIKLMIHHDTKSLIHNTKDEE